MRHAWLFCLEPISIGKNGSIEPIRMKEGIEMDGCPLFREHHRFFSTQLLCEATDEDLKHENEMLVQYCQADYRKCIRYKTYQELKIEYLVRKKLETQYGA
jgi:hypothetical protein